MRRALLPSLLLLAGCSESSLTVSFRVAPAFRNALNTISIDIFQPPSLAEFDCERLAFGEVSEEVQRLSNILSLTSSVTEVPLGELDRVAQKVFVAQGYDGTGRRMVIGCAMVGEIDGNQEVLLVGEPVKRVTRPEQTELTVMMGGELLAPAQFMVEDVLGRPLNGVEVRWEIDGAGGSGSKGVSTTDEDGNASILPTIPQIPGPFVLDVDVRWVEQDPDPVPGFVTPEAEPEFLPGVGIAYESGRVGPNAESGFAALLEDQVLPNAYRVIYVYKNTDGETQQRVSQSFVTDNPVLGLIESRVSTTRDRAIVIGLDDWFEVLTDGSVMRSGTYAPPGINPSAVVMSGSCEPGSAPQVMVFYEETFFPTVLGIYDDQGVGTAFFWDLGVVDAGCVTNEGASVERAILMTQQGGGDLGLLVVLQDAEGFFGRSWLALRLGTDFARDGGKEVMIGSQLQRDDVVVSRLTIRSTADVLDLVEQSVDEVPGLPIFNRGADLDGDSLLDVISLLQRATENVEDPPTFALHAALGREHQGVRISGSFDLPTVGLRDPQMMVLDFDRDGTPDVIVAERPGEGSQTRFELFRMGGGTRP